PTATALGHSTTPGLERIDLDRDGRGCHRVWHSDETAPTVVPKLSAATGLVYTYTKPAGGADDWYLTAIDFRTGAAAGRALAGEGAGFNNTSAPSTIGPDGPVSLGVLGGMVALRDRTPPARVAPEPPAIVLRARRLGAGRVRARVNGPDVELVKSVE